MIWYGRRSAPDDHEGMMSWERFATARKLAQMLRGPVFRAYVDLPEHSPVVGCYTTVHGWVAGRRDPGPIALRAGGVSFATDRTLRPDVEAALPGTRFSTGVRAELDLSAVPAAARRPGEVVTIPLELEAGGRVLARASLQAMLQPPAPGRANCFILRLGRSGGSTVYRMLAAHPDCCMAVPEEPYYFEAEYERGSDYYWKRYYPHAREQAVAGDARNRNLFYPWIPPRVRAYNPEARFVVLLRHPLERMISGQLWLQAKSASAPSLGERVAACRDRLARGEIETAASLAADRAGLVARGGLDRYPVLLEGGDYAAMLERWFACFARDRFLILDFHDIVCAPEATARQILEHLGLDPARHPCPVLEPRDEDAGFPDPLRGAWVEELARLRASGVDRAEEHRHRHYLEAALHADLAAEFRPKVAALEALLGRRMHWTL